MSHEIRTPLNGITGMTELLLDTDLTTDQREYLEMLQTSADSLLTLLNDILDFSKIEARKLDLERVGFPLRETLGDVLTTLALRAHKKNLELACHVRPNVPDELLGDPLRLRQILVNLVGNALKFTDRGEVVVGVEVVGCELPSTGQPLNGAPAVSPDGRRVQLHFSVSDTGIGIPKEKMNLLFQAFSQADGSTTRKYGGTGLGLAIAKQLVEMMGGRIWVETAAGKGSTFHFVISLDLAGSSVVHLTLASGEVPRASLTAASEHLQALADVPALIVADNSTNQKLLEEMLANWQMRTTVSSGRSGFEVLTQAREAGDPFRVVLIDSPLADIQAFLLADRIQNSPAPRPAQVMLLRTPNLGRDAVRCREVGVSAFLTKPVRQSTMFNTLATALGLPGAVAGSGHVEAADVPHTERRMRLLLAEDNIINQTHVVRLLEKRGHAIVVASNGKEALAALERQPFDLLLMDVQMPDMDGFEVTRIIREKERTTGGHIPIIALTAHAMKGYRERCLSEGMDGYVTKPLRMQDLLRSIDELAPAQPTAPAAPASLVRGEAVVADAEADGPPELNEKAMLARVDGDRDLLKELVGLYLRDGPKLLAEAREALGKRDPKRLQRAAHTLKGVVDLFHAQAAHAAAIGLESLAKQGDLGNATNALAELEKELGRLQPLLTKLAV